MASVGSGNRHRLIVAPGPGEGGEFSCWQAPGLPGIHNEPNSAHLLAAMDHITRQVLAQRQVAGAPDEVPAFQPLLDGLDLDGVVVTADALQTHPEAAEFLVTHKHAYYMLVVKANQPRLLARCASLPWHRVPVADRTRDRGHGRVEPRSLKAVSVRHFGFPHAAQVLQVTRKRRDLHTDRWQTVTVYAITSLPFELARPRPPGRPAAQPLGDRERPALGPRCDLRRGRLAGPHRRRPPRHGGLTEPGDRGAQPGRPGQRRRRAAPPRPRPLPTPGHPRDHPRMKPTSRQNDGALSAVKACSTPSAPPRSPLR
jgi:hypothetical protein